LVKDRSTEFKIQTFFDAALFGYSHLTGGWDGCQAEYVRVPFADVNLLRLPENLPDEKALVLADIACTGWHATELGKYLQRLTQKN
jgi:threonine dehydrogenase-like Zn-dependent dehydrogenase